MESAHMMTGTTADDVTRMIEHATGPIISPAPPHHLPTINVPLDSHLPVEYHYGMDPPSHWHGLDLDSIPPCPNPFADPHHLPSLGAGIDDMPTMAAKAAHVTVHGGGSEHYGGISGDVSIPVNDNIDVHVGGGGSYWQDQQHNMHTGGGHYEGGVTFKF